MRRHTLCTLPSTLYRRQSSGPLPTSATQAPPGLSAKLNIDATSDPDVRGSYPPDGPYHRLGVSHRPSPAQSQPGHPVDGDAWPSGASLACAWPLRV